MDFNERWNKAVEEKNSILCVGLDPALPGQRPKNTIPEGVDVVDFMKQIVEDTQEYAAAFKPNRQYVLGLPEGEIKDLNKLIHDKGAISIIDHKAVDIGSTNDSAFYHAQQEGFDGITYSPFPGNVKEAGEQAHARGLGLIVLTLMSNPEFKAIKHAKFEYEGKQIDGYLYFAHMTAQYGDAPVVGAPSEKNHVTLEELKEIKEIIEDKTILAPGIGAQGGQERYLIETFGKPIINVGRDIMYSENPSKNAKEYQQRFNVVRGE